MKIAAIFAAGVLACFSSAGSAVLIATGTTGDGKAYVTVPTITFNVNFWSSGINGIGLDIVHAWPTPGMVTTASGSGLSFSSLQNPSVVELATWSDHVAFGTALSDRDSVLRAPTSAGYSYTFGDVITLEGGTFILSSADPNFAVFSSGSYTVYLVGTNNGYSVGPITAAGVAVPEPTTVALFGSAALVLLATRRRKL